MTHIPKYIIGSDEKDLEEVKAKFMEWSGGKTFGSEFLTMEEAREKGLEVVDDGDNYSPFWLGDGAKKLVEMSEAGKSGAKAGKTLRDLYLG